LVVRDWRRIFRHGEKVSELPWSALAGAGGRHPVRGA
jgi:hypothetical protein